MPPEDTAAPGRPGVSDKVWAVLGLVAALVLAGISLDLLIGGGGRPAPAEAAPGSTGGDDDCGC